MRPELSERSMYYVDKNRYYELKYFCYQYPSWIKSYNSIEIAIKTGVIKPSKRCDITDPVLKYVTAREYYRDKIKLVDEAAVEADPDLSDYILKGVTEGLSYDVMCANEQIPCSRDTYYNRYRRFFFILDKKRD